MGVQRRLPAPTGKPLLLSPFPTVRGTGPALPGGRDAALESRLLENYGGGFCWRVVGERGAAVPLDASAGRLSAVRLSLDHIFPDICQDTNQTLFKPCQGSEEVPCNKPVAVSLSEDPCCPLHLRLPPQMYVPEQALAVPEELEAAPTELYLSAAELQPTESLPLEFSDVSWAACFGPWGVRSASCRKASPECCCCGAADPVRGSRGRRVKRCLRSPDCVGWVLFSPAWGRRESLLENAQERERFGRGLLPQGRGPLLWQGCARS